MKENQKIKQWILRYPSDHAKADETVRNLSAETGYSPAMAKLFYNRGLYTREAVTSFLRQDEAQLHSPRLMKDMDAAVERVRRAIADHEKIAIYGDYDVDGVTSVSLLYLYLTENGADVGYYIPSRSREGYGLSKPAIEKLRESGIRLMITVDTGVTAIEEIAYAKELGIETVVTDHHECRAQLPDACAVVNPHRPDDTYPFCELAGVGVVFKLICGMESERCREENISEIDGIRNLCRKYADLVAIGTIADVMPVVDENRLIVTEGLRLLQNTDRAGLRALMELASGGREKGSKGRKINSGFIGFVIAPRMNAAGRVSNASIAVELLLASDPEKANDLAQQLCELNTARQTEENRIAEQAYKKIEQVFHPDTDRVIVIDDDTWQQGIIGIVSSRVTERYGLPSILISFDGTTRGYPELDDLGKGSGRSVKGMNLVEALTACEDLLVRFGGHELAAGLTVRRGNIEEFRRRINEYAAQYLTDENLVPSIDADCTVEMRELTMRFAEEISHLEPFGISNPVPNLILCGATISRIIPMAGGKHIKLLLEKDGITMNAVWFGVGALRMPFEVGDEVDVLFQLNINEYQNISSLQMIVQDVHLSERNLHAYLAEKARYEEIRAGAEFTEAENVVPDRNDIAEVYRLLRNEYRNERTVFPMRRLLSVLRREGSAIRYVKLKFIIRILQELQICGVTESGEDCYVFDFYFQPTKTNIEKSSILRKLKSQQRRPEEN